MHWPHRYFYRVAAATGAVAFVALAACTSGSAKGLDQQTPTASPAGAPTGIAVSSSSSPAVRQPLPEGQPVEQTAWVRDRVAAVKQIYGFTEAGESWLDSYDFRQMAEQPAWFGSHGYNFWAGAGEAAPRSVMHELSHSYWGAFSVEGRPELSWQPAENGVAPALAAFRNDLEAFLRQPPDRFEPLRDRFRNLPNLTAGDYPDLFHFGEADLIYMTGGNLQLIPPILQKYFSGFLLPGGVGPDGGGGQLLTGWDEAVAWFNSLDGDDRRIAGEVFGIQHFPLGVYAGLSDSEYNGLDPDLITVYEQEEKQRLVDFSQQFDGIINREFALVDAVGADRGFDFWLAYLSDKLALHIRHPETLHSLGTERASELAKALDFYASIEPLTPEAQVESFRRAVDQPQVAELAVLLKPRAIVELFAEADSGSGVLAVLGSRAERLEGLILAVERVEAAAGQSTQAGAAELAAFLDGLPDAQLGSDIFLLLDMLRSARSGLASDVLPALSDETLRRLLEISPAAARAPEIGTARLLEAVGITGSSTMAEVEAGAAILAANSSGNFAIDAAYDEAVFTHFDRFVDSDPAAVLRAVTGSGMRLVPWISRGSDGAIRAMSGAREAAVDVLLALSGPRETAERILHLLVRKDPALAARLTAIAGQREGEKFTVRVIRAFTYDSYWSERSSGPNVSPSQIAGFFSELAEQIGQDAVSDALTAAIERIQADTVAGVIEEGGSEALEETLEAAMDASGSRVRGLLAELMTQSGLV